MDTAFEALVNTLDATATAVIAIADNSTALNMAHGWNMPGITLADLGKYASQLATDIREFGDDKLEAEDVMRLATMTMQVEYMRVNTVPQIWGANGPLAISAYVTTMTGVREKLRALMPQTTEVDPRTLPARLAKRIARLNAELDAVIVDRDTLTARMQMIDDAHETAESLPEDLASLKEAREKIGKMASDALLDSGQISKQEHAAAAAIEAINALQVEAQKLVDQCGEAYSVTTSKGLAGAFDQRAIGLTRSMQLWVVALVTSLIVAAVLGGQRVDLLSRTLAATDPQWGVIALNFALSLLSVGAPLWFAWVATKQVGQRFRLAEDYGYKASIAKAYEGYRREAAKLDPAFEARLFGSSLARLEEAPLRLIEEASHGSPLHEFMSSKKAQDVMATVPALRQKLTELMAEVQQTILAKSSKPPSGSNTQ